MKAWFQSLIPSKTSRFSVSAPVPTEVSQSFPERMHSPGLSHGRVFIDTAFHSYSFRYQREVSLPTLLRTGTAPLSWSVPRNPARETGQFGMVKIGSVACFDKYQIWSMSSTCSYQAKRYRFRQDFCHLVSRNTFLSGGKWIHHPLAQQCLWFRRCMSGDLVKRIAMLMCWFETCCWLDGPLSNDCMYELLSTKFV